MGRNVFCRVRHPDRRRSRRALETGRSAEHRNNVDSDWCRDPDRRGDHGLGRQQRVQGKYPDRPEIRSASPCRHDRGSFISASAYIVENSEIPPSGNPTPPPVALVFVNGVRIKWLLADTAIECALFPFGRKPMTVREAPSTMPTMGVNGQAAEPPPHEVPLLVQRLSARYQWPDVLSYVIWSPPPALRLASTCPFVLSRITNVSVSPTVPCRHIEPMSLPGPRASPVGSHAPSG